MTAPSHIHAAPEAWYTLAGETGLETCDGRVQIGRPGGTPVIVPSGLFMHHQTSQPATTLVNAWTPKGLCKK
jgi:hypothetical protein